MMIEQKIDAFRYCLVGWLTAMLRVFGAEARANDLWLANSRFECPVCRLIRALRAKKQVVTRQWAALCAECREWPRRVCRAFWRCAGVVFQIYSFQSLTAFALTRRAKFSSSHGAETHPVLDVQIRQIVWAGLIGQREVFAL